MTTISSKHLLPCLSLRGFRRNSMELYNKYDRKTLEERLQNEDFERVTLSFYRYVILDDAVALRDELYEAWAQLGVLGRIYLSREGVNAQISVPESNFEQFETQLDALEAFKDMPLKIAVEDGSSFIKLIIKVKKQIVADGLTENEYDVTNVGEHLNAEQFNAALEKENSVVVDMRNHYESEVGHFEGAILPEAETFREELPLVLQKLHDRKDDTVLLYCTGGIRCEKASAYLKHHGFADVNQLHGGIISYAHQVKKKDLDSKFKGVNFVFDDRLGERITDDVLAECHQCSEACDHVTNCANVACNLLFIQCEKCAEQFEDCCTPRCSEVNKLSEEQQFALRAGNENRKKFNKGVKDVEQLRNTIKEQQDLLQNGEDLVHADTQLKN